MRRVEDLQLGYGLSHALACEREMDECPTCIELRTMRRAWPPARMMDTADWCTENPRVEFASNFHVLRVKHETEQAQEAAVVKARVKEILRRA